MAMTGSHSVCYALYSCPGFLVREWFWCSRIVSVGKAFIREHEIAEVTKKARIFTILLEIFSLCVHF